MQDLLPLGGRLERVEQVLQPIHPLDAFARNLPLLQLRPRPVDDLIGVAAQHVSHGAVERFGIAAEVAPKRGDRRRLRRHDARDVRIPRPGADRRQRRDQPVQQHRRLHERRHVVGVVELICRRGRTWRLKTHRPTSTKPISQTFNMMARSHSGRRSRNSIITISVYLRKLRVRATRAFPPGYRDPSRAYLFVGGCPHRSPRYGQRLLNTPLVEHATRARSVFLPLSRTGR